MDVLAQLGVGATFFMLGERVQALPRVARMVVEAGYDVQLHAHRHIRHDELTEQEIESDTVQALAALAAVGVRPTWWRTPWGVRTDATDRVAARHGLTLVHWTIETHDWRGDSPSAMLRRAGSQIEQGAIVLMHDALGPGATRLGVQNTVELLAPLVAAARSAGLDAGALGDAPQACEAAVDGHRARTHDGDGGEPSPSHSFAVALEQLAAGASELDSNPRFPAENFKRLTGAGVPQLAADRETDTLARESALIRAVAGADASTARILDGHFNGVERLALLADAELREREFGLVRDGALLLGVWGADPAPGEGPPARIEAGERGETVLNGFKTFCSGAGGVQRALVVARDEHDARRLAYVDVTSAISIDRGWYRASGLRASESHRVQFLQTPVLAVLGGADEVLCEPWFSRDAVRTAATWAGIADRILLATVEAVGDRALDELRLHALGRMRLAQGSIDRWLDHATSVLGQAAIAARGDLDAPPAAEIERWRTTSAQCRLALAEAASTIASEAVRVSGSRPLIAGGALDRARRDLDLFLLQHRLDPKLVELGERTLIDRGGG